MSNNTEDTGVLIAILQRLSDFRLPRLLELNERMDAGERLSERDMEFLAEVMEDARSAHSRVDHHPEVQPLYARIIALYSEITTKGLENEKGKPA
jgi:hypothetical protein